VVLVKLNPLRINVGFLLHASAGTHHDFDIEVPSVQVGDDLRVGELQGVVRLTRTGEGLYLQGKLGARTTVSCNRCLTEFEQPLEIELGDLLAYPPGPEAEALLSVPETAMLDLAPLLREYLVLDIPSRPLCRPDCEGLCPECGNNLNESTCEHPESQIDPRLASLSSLLS
jgi:uncharacterized protein